MSFLLPLITFYVECYNTKKDKFFVLHSGVAIRILSNYYNVFVKEGLPSLEDLSDENYKKFTLIGEKYLNENYSKEQVSKAAYVLQSIAINEIII